MAIQSRSSIDVPSLDEGSSLEEVIEAYNQLADSVNHTNKLLSIQSNFDGYIAEDVKIPATSSVKIQHFLGVKPKWRILLKQTGNGVLTDIPSEWTDKVISIYNNGAVEVTVSVFIARE